MVSYTMRKRSKHYGHVCEKCQQRIRIGRKFTIGVINPCYLYHAACTPETPEL